MTREEIIKEAQEQVNYRTPLHTEDFIHGYLVGAETREKQIAELDDERSDLDMIAKNYAIKIADLEKENAEAKDLIRNLLRVTYGEGWNYSLDVKVKAEQFLRGSQQEKCSACSVCGYENGTDAYFDRYAVQVQNGEGYYDERGKFHYYAKERFD